MLLSLQEERGDKRQSERARVYDSTKSLSLTSKSRDKCGLKIFCIHITQKPSMLGAPAKGLGSRGTANMQYTYSTGTCTTLLSFYDPVCMKSLLPWSIKAESFRLEGF